MGLYWLRYIYIIYTYIEYILYRSNIEKYREKCQFIDCFFLSFINVPKLIMSDSIELHLVWLLPSDIDKAASMFRDVLGAKVSEKHPQPDHGVYTVFVELGETKIELLNPLGDKSPIQNFLDKNKSGGMHHICIEVDNINEAMKDLKSKGIRLLSEESKIGAHGKPVVFLHPKDCNGVLVELEQV